MVARQRGADGLVGVGDHDREAVQVVDHPLVPGPVDRQFEVGGRDVPNDPQVVGEVGVAGDRPRRDQRPHAARAAGIRPWEHAGEEVDARESRPLAVRLEQLGRLPPLDPAAAHRAQQLHEAEVALEAAVEAAESLEADDAERPRAETALAEEPVGDRGVGSSFRRSSSSERVSRASVAPRRAWRPSLRSSAGEKRARSEVVGGMLSPSRRSVAARTIRRSIARASLARISWPQSARSRAWATVASRTGRSPRRRRTVAPSSGSRWKRRTNGVWSSSSARQKRSWSRASSPVARSRRRRRAAARRPRDRPDDGVQDPVAERAGPHRTLALPRGRASRAPESAGRRRRSRVEHSGRSRR